MKCLEVVLFAAIVHGYAFTAIAEKIAYNNLTFQHLDQLCSEQHHDIYENGTHKLVNELLSEPTNNCSDSIPQIKEIVSRIIPCFSDENKPNESDLNTIYERITKQLCIHYKIVSFSKDNNCYEKRRISDCLQKNLNMDAVKTNDIFYSLAMLHSKEDCRNLEMMMFCLTGGDDISKCSLEIKTEREDLLKKFSSVLKCI